MIETSSKTEAIWDNISKKTRIVTFAIELWIKEITCIRVHEMWKTNLPTDMRRESLEDDIKFKTTRNLWQLLESMLEAKKLNFTSNEIVFSKLATLNMNGWLIHNLEREHIFDRRRRNVSSWKCGQNANNDSWILYVQTKAQQAPEPHNDLRIAFERN